MISNEKTNHHNQISGLNNLGNTCFFNSILQNLAQTSYLKELLGDNLKSENVPFFVEHHDDYDSELTDHEEVNSESETKKDNRKANNVTLQDHIKLDDESDEQDREEEIKEKKKKLKSKSSKSLKENELPTVYHRSLRLDSLSLVLKESPGPMTKHLYETIKNMTNSKGVVNPMSLFSTLAKKVPTFKGYQQQDSHELLRNLLDTVKSEELRRRQASILEYFKVNKSSELDDLTKRKIKRYGRLSSYTFIDQLFGGHLLSSIVCTKCDHCTHKVEPFLDLSLPIIADKQANSALVSNQNLNAKKITSKIATNEEDTPKYSKKSKIHNVTADDFKNEEPVYDQKANKVSKHQTKKQKKESKRSKKKGKHRNDSVNEEESNSPNEKSQKEEDETKKGDDDGDLNQIKIAEKCEDSKSENEEAENLLEPLENLSIGKEDQVKADTEEIQTKPEEVKQEDSGTEKSDDSVNAPEHKEDILSTELTDNHFKLEAMKSISKTQIDLFAECTLESCLSRFTSSEFLSDKICCENCSKHESEKNNNKPIKSYSNAIKQYLICELPLILTIHLKRFQQQGFRLVKSDKYVKFPLVLDMTPYTSLHCVNTNESKGIFYSLYGVVEHSGRLNSGHYTAYVRTNVSELDHLKLEKFMSKHRLCHLNKMLKRWRESKSQENRDQDSNKLIDETTVNGEANNRFEELENNLKNENWFYVSDSSVSSAPLSRVLKCQAYILFYERI